MFDIQRIEKIIDWLIFNKIVKTRRELAERLGYTESSLSQIINKKVALSEKFIKNLSEIHNSINLDWLLTGDGPMLKNETIKQDCMEENERVGILEETISILKKELNDKQKVIDTLSESNKDLIHYITSNQASLLNKSAV